MSSKLLVLTIVLVLLSGIVAAETFNIPADFETIQAGINAAEDGDIVLVAPGEYTENIDFRGKEITVIGNPEDPTEVIINGGEDGSVVTMIDGFNAPVLLGFTIINGVSNGNGGGINCLNTNAVLSHLTIEGNSADGNGGGISWDADSGTMESVIIRDNEARLGGGIWFRRGAGSISNISIGNNIGTQAGGGIYYTNRFGHPEINNIAIHDNRSLRGGGIYLTSNDENLLAINHLTLTNNQAEDDGGGIFISGIGMEFQNSILYFNEPEQVYVNANVEIITDFTDIEGGQGGFNSRRNREINFNWGDGIIDEDPLFADIDNGDYHLTADSPCIDAGDPDSPDDPDETRSDMGAYYFSQNVEQRISLVVGWNMISLNILPLAAYYDNDEDLGPDIILMMDQLREGDNHHLIQMKNGAGQFYAPAFDFNDIPYWNMAEGYLLKLDDSLEVSWRGEPIPANSDIILEAGWSFIAYYPEYELDASAPDFYVLSSIIDNVELAKDGSGGFLVPAFEFSNMQAWRPTQGYQVKVDDDVVLNYPEEQEEQDIFVQKILPALASTGSNMSLLVQGLFSNENSIVKAYDRFNTIVGQGKIDSEGQCGLAIWGDDPTTESKDGLIDGESFSLMVGTVNLEPTVFYIGMDFTFKTDKLIVIDAELQMNIPTNYSISSAFPNPFNSTVKLNFSVPEAAVVSIKLYDLTGKLVTEVANGYHQPGQHSTIWDAAGVPSGLYFARMEAGGFSQAVKLMLMR